MEQHYKYFAFISYSSHDMEWGRRIQRKLEHYRMPATLCSEHGWKRCPINPVFFAPTDIQPGGLTAELQERLRTSRHLIVVCSPHSAQSEWVGKEIAFFHQLGRTGQIHFFIVDGQPHSGNSATECFNPIVDTLGLPEILGANVNEAIYRWAWLNRERAYVQLITKLLGVEFDTIWQRHKLILAQQVLVGCVLLLTVLAALFGVWRYSQPVDVALRVQEVSEQTACLPPLTDAVVTVALGNEIKTDTIHSLQETATLKNIPSHLINKEVRVSVQCRYFLPLDTVMQLERSMSLPMRRDPNPFGHVRFRLWNPAIGQALAHTKVVVDGHEVKSDADGNVSLSIPLKDQKPCYPVSAAVPLLDSMVSMPCGPDDAIQCAP